MGDLANLILSILNTIIHLGLTERYSEVPYFKVLCVLCAMRSEPTYGMSSVIKGEYDWEIGSHMVWVDTANPVQIIDLCIKLSSRERTDAIALEILIGTFRCDSIQTQMQVTFRDRSLADPPSSPNLIPAKMPGSYTTRPRHCSASRSSPTRHRTPDPAPPPRR